jgi:Tol biopolymer transport system component
VIGTTLSHFKITAKLGEGGMGEVYRAIDTKLDREVAIKVLPEAVTRDPERLARFEREAKVLASLNHPNIGSIYGLEEDGAKRLLVLELIEGEDLQERLERGAIPVDEAMSLAMQMATGLEVAHEQGIIHRDLKPANVKVTPDGQLKILDFGLAKSWGSAPTDSDLTHSPTLTAQMTGQGVILGTAAYMSPEQARGEEADRRADIWSFGVVLFEMLTGRRLFTGKTTSDVLAAVLRADPDWDALPARTPAAVRKLLRRCLSRKRKQRLQAIGDARIELEEALASPFDGDMAEALGEQTMVTRGISALTWLLASLVIVLIGLLMWNLRSDEVEPRASMRLGLTLPDEIALAPPASMPLGIGSRSLTLSPDGSRLIYVSLAGDERVLSLREMHRGEVRVLGDTEGAYRPFFSPDGEWVGFFAGGKLKKVSLSGGSAIDLAAAPIGLGGAWSEDGHIYFVPDEGTGVKRIPASAGAVENITELNKLTAAFSQSISDVLPGGRGILFTESGGGIGVYSLTTGEQRFISTSGGGARYLASGHILFPEFGRLMVAPFDLDLLEMTGPAEVALEGVQTGSFGNAQFGLSENGLLVFVEGDSLLAGDFTWLDADGKREPIGMARGVFGGFSLSPDGLKVAVPIVDGKEIDIWIYDIGRGTPTRLTFDGKSAVGTAWTPDGKRVLYNSLKDGVGNTYAKGAQGDSTEVKVTDLESYAPLGRISFDGKLLPLAVRGKDSTSRDIYLAPLSEEILSGKSTTQPQPFLETPFQEMFYAISPDGNWMAYYSNETGNWEVYVQPMDPSKTRSGRVRISIDGGEEPIWSADGSRLFYRWGNKFYAVDVTLGAEFKAGSPEVLFEGPYINVPGWSYDVSPDGERFLVIVNEAVVQSTAELAVMTNFFDHIQSLSSTEGR